MAWQRERRAGDPGGLDRAQCRHRSRHGASTTCRPGCGGDPGTAAERQLRARVAHRRGVGRPGHARVAPRRARARRERDAATGRAAADAATDRAPGTGRRIATGRSRRRRRCPADHHRRARRLVMPGRSDTVHRRSPRAAGHDEPGRRTHRRLRVSLDRPRTSAPHGVAPGTARTVRCLLLALVASSCVGASTGRKLPLAHAWAPRCATPGRRGVTGRGRRAAGDPARRNPSHRGDDARPGRGRVDRAPTQCRCCLHSWPTPHSMHRCWIAAPGSPGATTRRRSSHAPSSRRSGGRSTRRATMKRLSSGPLYGLQSRCWRGMRCRSRGDCCATMARVHPRSHDSACPA